MSLFSKILGRLSGGEGAEEVTRAGADRRHQRQCDRHPVSLGVEVVGAEGMQEVAAAPAGCGGSTARCAPGRPDSSAGRRGRG